MNNIVNLGNYKKKIHFKDQDYSSKLCRIRDTIEDELHMKSLLEKDQLAVSLAAGRYAAMNLQDILGQEDTIKFFKDCINTSKINKN